jgi:hypothetical protein
LQSALSLLSGFGDSFRAKGTAMLRRALHTFRFSPLHGFFYLALPAAVGTALVTGCNSASPNQACTPYTPPSTFDQTQPVVSFSKDVLPIFGRACAFDSCHGGNPPEGDLFLGSDATRVYANLVSVPAKIFPALPRIAPGDAANSFLLRKIDGDACAIAGCTDACAEAMPQALDLLPEADRLVIRAWVLEGAASDAARGAAGSGAQ